MAYEPIVTREEYEFALKRFTWNVDPFPHAFNRWFLELRRLIEAQQILDPRAEQWNSIAPACHVRRV